MQIVTDSATDISLTAEQRKELNIHVVPLVVSLDGQTWHEGVDIGPDKFYPLLAATKSLPVTSQPAPGDFAEVYRRLAKTDPEILSIHMTSGLSGTFNSSKLGASAVPEAKVIHIDTKTLSAAAGWQVEAAARAVKAGWPMDRVLALVQKISDATESIYTLAELKYLIHGGRISHMKGLIASLLNIKPVIGVEKTAGIYKQMAQVRNFVQARKELVNIMLKTHAEGTRLRVQVLYSHQREEAEVLKNLIAEKFDCVWKPMGPMSLVLGAHTGPSMIGVAYAPESVFEGIPA